MATACRRHACGSQSAHPWAASAPRAAAAAPRPAGRRRRCCAAAAASGGGDAGSPSASTSYDEDVASTSAPAAPGEDYGYMQEYAALKAQLLDNTRKSGGAVGLYLLFAVNGQAALLAMAGAAASYAYLSWLIRDVDAVSGSDRVPIWEANKIEAPLLRRAAKLAAAYRAALRPRLLVPAGLGLALGVYGRLAGHPAELLYSGCLLLGFLSYKGALVVKLIDDLTPKSFGPEASRPRVEKFEDELDQWGRPKKRLATPIDAMPEEQQAKAYAELEKQQARERAREQQ
ncbi:hypothetical protein HT031_002592 [Scenedesmus sp. PABB004]|nr:hypothetical protein HT031_002592 [Scenedesmus sp. PABB004]